MRPVRISYWMVTRRITLSGPSAGSGLRRMRALPTRTRGRRVTGRARRACCPARTRAAAPPGVRGAAPRKPPGARCTPGVPRCAPRSARRPGTPRPASAARPVRPRAHRKRSAAARTSFASSVRAGARVLHRSLLRGGGGGLLEVGDQRALEAARPRPVAAVASAKRSRKVATPRTPACQPSRKCCSDPCGALLSEIQVWAPPPPQPPASTRAVGLLVSDSAAARAWNTVNRASVASCWWWLMRAGSRPYASRRAARYSRGASPVCPGVVGDPFRIAYGLRRWRLGGWGAHDAPDGVRRGDDVDQVSTTACRTASSSRVRPGRPASPAQRAGSDGLSSPRTAAPSRSRRRTPWCRARRRPREAVGLRPFWRGCLVAQATPRTQPSEQIAGRERDDRGDGDVCHVHRIPIADSSSTRSGDSVAARLR